MSDEPKPEKPEEFGDNAVSALVRFVERIEVLDAEKTALNEDIKAVYAEAAGDGMDKKAIRQIIKYRKADLEKTIDLHAIVETYVKGIANRQGELGDWARTYRSRRAKVDIDQTGKAEYASPLADLLQKGRTANDRTEGDGGEAQP